MNTQQTIDVPAESQAVTIRDAVEAVERMPAAAPDAKPQVTAAQAKIEAVATLTATAYAKASELRLTPEESKALQADFPDEAFKTGAAGKENLLYIEHAFLRDRLNQVIGLGQWALIPRNRWAEDYRTNAGKPASRVYTEAMLMVRGCFVSEAVGEMEYYPGNAAQNYGDAVEGAKTAAFRRCCKEFGIGLQAWKKDWCDGWWQRKRGVATPQRQPQQAPQAQPKPQAPVEATEKAYPVVTVLGVTTKSSQPDAKKPWTVHFIKFNDSFADFECGTFDRKIADLAKALQATGETAKLVTKPGRKEGSIEIVSLSQAVEPPEDNVPMEYDTQAEAGVTP